ncbi:ABC transporter permease [Planctomonas sp. JC2975]|uniref:ABC transporter permease n=1 Tax=Planctomonas sp. JC2975 TaxID=2729626 RepID=UPI00147614C3|nr:ABC transporter permease [Planctomonas sp. JC2975]NNC11594.1 ABC transporter permease [Planctomonas sp. JC2975]
MKTTAILRLETVRMLRDPKYLALAVLAPIGFYLLFATLFGGGPTRPGELPGTVEIMVAMAAYGAIWAVLSTTGPRISEERQIGWLTQVRAMPLRASSVIGAKIVASVLTALPAIVLVCLTAAIVKGVSLSAGQWVSLVAAMWVGSAAFAMLGIAIGFAVGADAAYPLSYGLYMALSALGGLWVPPDILPAGMKDAAVWLPTYNLAKLGWDIAGGSVPTLASVANLFGWTLVFGCLALLAYRAPSLRPRPRRKRRAVLAAATAE